ncbi:Gfo/Idh/MocA family protein [Tardiphaga sp. 71_E8_N1_1]|uniref:Gfo/Idh/MocA family protein n=1 Tax=Tardiphaga sp. 71_E8_N1_1 TaxID=3240784 RepID=UPI003F88FF24
MATRPIGVGIIGASTQNPGWAILAHIPAIEALSDFKLQAVSTSNSQSAAASTAALGVPAFDSAETLIAHGEVDLVVASVKVPDHRVLTAAALNAGKMVFTEWPLGRTYQEAEDLAGRAKRFGVRTVIGLQAQFSPALQRARQLVAEGYIGDIIATTLTGTGMIWGSEIPRSFAYTLDIENGGGVLPVPTMHGLDALTYVLGDFVTISAEAALDAHTSGSSKTAALHVPLRLIM